MKTEQARRFASEYAAAVSRSADTPSEVADVLHSCILASMLMMTSRFSISPEAASTMVEIAVQEAVKDFAQFNNETRDDGGAK